MKQMSSKVEYYSKHLRCKNCPDPEVVLDNLFILEATVTDENTKIRIRDIPKMLHIFNIDLKLVLITAYTTNHFISFYFNNKNTILEFDDKHKTPTVRRKNYMIIPQFLVYKKVSK